MKSYIYILLLVAVLLLFFHLSSRPLLSSGEARASEIAVEMLARGNILIPYLNEEILLTKPVLFHWFIILSYKIFGINELSARLPSVLSGLFVVLLVYLFGKRFWGPKAGFISGLILVTSPLFFWSARCARIDMFLLCCITLSFYCFWRGYEKLPQKNSWFLGFFFFMGMGFLSKGPIGLFAPLLASVLFLIHMKKYGHIKRMNWFWGVLIFLAVVLPWYISIYFMVPHYKSRLFFLQQNVVWLSGRGWFKWFVYIPYLVLDFFPWSLFLIVVLVCTWTVFLKRKDEKLSFLWIWSLVVFLIFSCMGKKTGRYILPMYPAVSLMTGGMLAKLDFKKTFNVALSIMVLLWTCVLIAVNSFVGITELFPGRIDVLLVTIVNNYLLFERLWITAVAATIIFLGIIGMTRIKKELKFAVTVAIMSSSLIMFTAHVIPVEERYYSPKPFCEKMKEIIPKGAPVCAYNSWDNTIRFYFGRHVDVIRNEEQFREFLNNNGVVYCIMWKDVYDKLPVDIKTQLAFEAGGYKVLENEVILLSHV